MATNKMIKKDFYNVLTSIVREEDFPQKVGDKEMTYSQMIEFINHEIELLNRKNSSDSSKTMTAKQIARQEVMEAILNKMEIDKPYLVSDLIKTFPEAEGKSTSEVSRMLHDLVKAGYVERIEEKRKAYFLRRG
jgi:uncharacterized membrane protein